MTVFLTALQILFIHARLIDTTGGEHGVRDLGLLESAVARTQATFDGKELYPDLFQKAAALMQSLGHNHPFMDGNKRTAITAASLFLIQNGRRLQTTNEALEVFTFLVVNEQPSLDEMASWFQSHTIPEK
jgi:death-on-curing protein